MQSFFSLLNNTFMLEYKSNKREKGGWQMKKKKSSIALVIYILSIITCIVSIIMLVLHLWPSLTQENYSSKYTNTTNENSDETKINQTQPTTLKPNPIDFKSLIARNSDIYAWIKVPGTNVDYPVAQAYSEDDSFYLNHGIDKTYDYLGMIYSEKHNNLNFTDPHTVLYGHNYVGGKMFRSLYNFKDKNFFDKHKYIYIYQPGKILTYQVFAAYEYDDRHLLNSFDCHNVDVFREYVKEATNPTSLVCNVNKSVEVTENDKILTLSTCVVGVPTSRYLVQGVLIKDEPTS